MKRIQYLSLIVSALIMVMAVSGCRLKVPVKEMTTAKNAIAQAQAVKAEKYAPEEFEAAKNKLMDSHTDVTDKNVDKAKKDAEEATRLANAAYDKAIPILAKDTLAIAEKSLDDARETAAEKLAADDFREADNKYRQANEDFQNKKYTEAYQGALEADRKAKLARETAMGRSGVLRDAIAEVRAVLDEAIKNGAKEYCPEKVALAEDYLTKANASLDAKEMKKGFAAQEAAKVNADEAYMIAMEKTAKNKLDIANALINKANTVKLNDQQKNDINAAKEAAQNAKNLLGENRFKDSIVSSDEAIQLACKALGINVADAGDYLSGRDVSRGGSVTDADGTKDYWEYKVVWRQQIKDCLWLIAGKYYKNGKLWKKIYDFNKSSIKDPNLIFPGQIIKVPKPAK